MDRTASKMTSIVALMAVFSLAICFIIIGASSEELKRNLAIGNAEIGRLIFTLFLTGALVQVVIGPLVDKFGYKPVAIVGFLVVSCSMFVMAFAPSYQAALVACMLLGIGAMCLNTVGNTLIPVVLFGGKDPARASNFGNAFFGLGLVVTPLIFSMVDYKTGVFALGGLLIVFLLATLATEFPAAATGYQFSMAVKLLGKPAVLIAALALFCYISLESSMNNWVKSYMTEMLGGAQQPGAESNAGFVLSLFGVAMMAGRFLTSAIKNLTAIGVKLIAGAAIVAMAAILLMIVTTNAAMATFAVILTGLVFAPIFPTVVGVTFAKFEPRLYGSIFGIIFAVGLLGGTFVPSFVGQWSTGRTIQQSLPIVLAMAAALFVISMFLKSGTAAGEKKTVART